MPLILQVAVFLPVPQYFDYLPPIGIDHQQLQPGIRLRVPYNNLKKIGLLIAVNHETAVSQDKLKCALEILDSSPLLPLAHLQLIQWASQYYHYPIGEAIATALPASLSRGKSTINQAIVKWLSCAIIQQLPEKPLLINTHLQLNPAQQQVVTQVCQRLTQFYPCLLDGITGSGKTEVYLQIIQQVLQQDKQALVLVPEINLTPQMLARFQQRFTNDIVILHSKVDKSERLQAWLAARDGQARVIIGTRSAIWTPLKNIGIIIVDEEHDPSYKQQDHFRYSARDIALVRAQRAKIPVILGSATPSLDSLYHANQQRYQHFILPERVGTAVHPTFHLVDMRQQPIHQRLSQQLCIEITHCLAAKQQTLLFINRRGYAPTFTCFSCGWIAQCKQCDSHLTYHDSTQQLLCHHCGYYTYLYKQCPQCQHTELHLIGQGTERIENELQQYFPQARIARIDSDSTRKEGIQTILDDIHQGHIDILVGTQMLAKGHHFPNVTLVGVLNMDSGLFSIDFRASERMAQLLIQVAGRAGRAESPGKVVIQTYHPQHPLFVSLIQQDYAAFAQKALEERQQADLPPFSRLALLRADANEMEQAMQFLQSAKLQAKQQDMTDIQLWGPVQAPMEKRNNRYHAQLLLQSKQRDKLHTFLRVWLPQLKSSTAKLRWSLDIDPQNLL